MKSYDIYAARSAISPPPFSLVSVSFSAPVFDLLSLGVSPCVRSSVGLSFGVAFYARISVRLFSSWKALSLSLYQSFRFRFRSSDHLFLRYYSYLRQIG